MKETYYKKKGRRYVPVLEHDPELQEAMHKGNHLVMVYPGGRSVRYNIDPAFAPMIAAGWYAENAMSLAVREATTMRPSRTPITEAQRAAWENLCKSFGNDRYALNYDAARTVAEAGVKAMVKEAEKLLRNPAVKKAYDHFMLIYKLTKEEEQK